MLANMFTGIFNSGSALPATLLGIVGVYALAQLVIVPRIAAKREGALLGFLWFAGTVAWFMLVPTLGLAFVAVGGSLGAATGASYDTVAGPVTGAMVGIAVGAAVLLHLPLVVMLTTTKPVPRALERVQRVTLGRPQAPAARSGDIADAAERGKAEASA